jgi:hypothetical protein
MSDRDDAHDDDDDEQLDPELAEQFEAWFTKRTADEQRKRDRAKPPKDFADALDRIADAVADKLEDRAAERRRARDDADQEPTRTKRGGGDGFLGLLGGKSQAS